MANLPSDWTDWDSAGIVAFGVNLPSEWSDWQTGVTLGGSRGPSPWTGWASAITPAHQPWRVITPSGPVVLVPHIVP